MQQGTDDHFRRRVLAADARHVPTAAGFGQFVPIHSGILTADGKGCAPILTEANEGIEAVRSPPLFPSFPSVDIPGSLCFDRMTGFTG